MLFTKTREHVRELGHSGNSAAPLDAEGSGRVTKARKVRAVVERNFLERLAGGDKPTEKSAEERIARSRGIDGLYAKSGHVPTSLPTRSMRVLASVTATMRTP